MKTLRLTAILVAFGLVCASGAVAEVGVTDNCQDDIEKLEDDIKEHRDDYTTGAIRKAKNQLLEARANRLNPAKCRENFLDARKALREGKSNRKDRD